VFKTTAGALALAIACSAGVFAQSYKFRSTWKAPGAQAVDMAGKKVAVVVISQDEGLRTSAEEAMARELTARGSVGVAAYRTIPKELLQDADKTREWFERTGVAGVVVLRVVSVEKEKVYSTVVWTTTSYQNFSNYYATGWQTATPIGRGREITTIAVETLLFDVAKGTLFWGGVTETTDPKNVQTYVHGLAAEVAKELQREKLVNPKSK
jgi:hypothetical protein